MFAQRQRTMSRRLFLVGSSSLALSGCGPAACTYEVASLAVTATSMLYPWFLKDFLPALAAHYAADVVAENFDVSTLSFTKTEKTVSPTNNDYNTVVDVAQKAGLDVGAAVKIARAIGSDAYITNVRKNVPMLLINNEVIIKVPGGSEPIPLNGFDVEVYNPTDSPIGGQMQIAFVDEKTGRQEGYFFTDSLSVPVHEKLVFRYVVDFDFVTPGIKQIVIRDTPIGLTAKTTAANVLPVRAV